MRRVPLLVAASLLLALPLVPTASALEDPICQLTDSLCTVYQRAVRTVDRVCDAAVQGGCPLGST